MTKTVHQLKVKYNIDTETELHECSSGPVYYNWVNTHKHKHAHTRTHTHTVCR